MTQMVIKVWDLQTFHHHHVLFSKLYDRFQISAPRSGQIPNGACENESPLRLELRPLRIRGTHSCADRTYSEA